MNLIVCQHCFDWVAVFSVERTCRCGRSGGWYGDRLFAWGPCQIVLLTGADVTKWLAAPSKERPSGRWSLVGDATSTSTPFILFPSKREAHLAAKEAHLAAKQAAKRRKNG